MKVVAHDPLAVRSKLFSSGLFQELARRGRSPLFSAIVRDSGLQASLRCGDRVSDVFETAFRHLQRQGCRDEYVYKSALVRRLLLGRHSLRTACLLNEFRVGECKADLAILNGTSTVYEIKSERDSLVRLGRQLRAYSEVFARVFVVTAETHLKAIINSVPLDVGIMCLSDRFQTSVVRDAVDSSNSVSVASIFDSIRTEEARMILSSFGIEVPHVPNTELSCLLREHFTKLAPRQAHDGMVAVLKKTRNQKSLSELVANLPTSLHTAALSVPIRKLDHVRLIGAIRTSVSEALAWG